MALLVRLLILHTGRSTNLYIIHFGVPYNICNGFAAFIQMLTHVIVRILNAYMKYTDMPNSKQKHWFSHHRSLSFLLVHTFAQRRQMIHFRLKTICRENGSNSFKYPLHHRNSMEPKRHSHGNERARTTTNLRPFE